MSGTNKLLDRIEIILKNDDTGNLLPVLIDVFDNSLSRKWLTALNHLIKNNYHLEKNYCFMGFIEHKRNAKYICNQINQAIAQINSANLDYKITDHFTVENTIVTGPIGEGLPGGWLVHDKLNQLHRYFEDLQGVSGQLSTYYAQADDCTRWHIRQLNLLCHEYESLVLSLRKQNHASEWRRPSQLMCWLQAPRFVLEDEDYELFGIDTINRPLGGVFVGVNKAVGKHHFEVFMDEGRWGNAVDELTTSTLRSQTEAAGDFDIEWSNDPGSYHWQKTRLAQFREWLIANNFDPDDKKLTIGHPQCGQVDLINSFGTTNFRDIWRQLASHLNVHSIKTSDSKAVYKYNWTDSDYMQQQIQTLKG